MKKFIASLLMVSFFALPVAQAVAPPAIAGAGGFALVTYLLLKHHSDHKNDTKDTLKVTAPAATDAKPAKASKKAKKAVADETVKTEKPINAKKSDAKKDEVKK